MNATYFEVYQGDLTNIVYIRPGPLNAGDAIDVNWTCKVAVNDSNGASAVTARTVTEKATVPVTDSDSNTSDEECFVCYLTPDETSSLTEDTGETNHTWMPGIGSPY